jgi:hypothetical protein
MLTKHGACKDVCEKCPKCKKAIEAFKVYMQNIGARGGKAMVPKGLSVTGNQYRHGQPRAFETA